SGVDRAGDADALRVAGVEGVDGARLADGNAEDTARDCGPARRTGRALVVGAAGGGKDGDAGEDGDQPGTGTRRPPRCSGSAGTGSADGCHTWSSLGHPARDEPTSACSVQHLPVT